MTNPMLDDAMRDRAGVVIEKVAARYTRRLQADDATHRDLVQEGWTAILHDARSFSPGKGTWEAYVKVVVGAAMRRSLYVQRAPVSGSPWRAHKWGADLRGVEVEPDAHVTDDAPDVLLIGSQFLRDLTELLHNVARVVPNGALALRVIEGEAVKRVATSARVSVSVVTRAVTAFRTAVNDCAPLGALLEDQADEQ